MTIEAIKQPDGRYLAYTDNGREHTGIEVLSWAKKVEELGAGEIVLTSVDREGTGTGFDIKLIAMVSSAVSIPVVAHGGAGNLQHIHDSIEKGGASAVAVASVLHYGYSEHRGIHGDYTVEGNIEFLKNKRSNETIKKTSINEIKHYLHTHGVYCRYTNAENIHE